MDLKIKKAILFVLIISAVLVLAVTTQKPGIDTPAPAAQPKVWDGKNAVVDFYVMSKCGYAANAENSMISALKEVGDAVDLRIAYIGGEDAEGGFSSLHGQTEVDGDMVQLCAAKYNPNQYLNLITCMNANVSAIPSNWQICANKSGISQENIRRCSASDDGRLLLSESFKEAAARGAFASPTIYINGVKYEGQRRTIDFVRAICWSFKGPPESCKDVPPPVAIEAIMLSDRRCEECEKKSEDVRNMLKTLFPGMVFRELDYGTEEGRAMFDTLGLKYLPATILNESITRGEDYNAVKKSLDIAGGYYSLRMSAMFDPKTGTNKTI
jgi:hypothetical protein